MQSDIHYSVGVEMSSRGQASNGVKEGGWLSKEQGHSKGTLVGALGQS